MQKKRNILQSSHLTLHDLHISVIAACPQSFLKERFPTGGNDIRFALLMTVLVKLSLRAKRSNLSFSDGIAAHRSVLAMTPVKAGIQE